MEGKGVDWRLTKFLHRIKEALISEMMIEEKEMR
jgi:hypothetical protein